MGPGLYSEIGKKARDLLYKDYLTDQKFTVTTYTSNGVVSVKLRLPTVLNKFLQPISLPAEEFFLQWKSLSGPPLKLQEVFLWASHDNSLALYGQGKEALLLLCLEL